MKEKEEREKLENQQREIQRRQEGKEILKAKQSREEMERIKLATQIEKERVKFFILNAIIYFVFFKTNFFLFIK